MPICAAWLLTHAAAPPTPRPSWKAPVFMSERYSLTPILRSPGRGFLARTRSTYLTEATLPTHAARRDAAKRALENAQKLEPNSPETLLALGYYQYLGAA